MCFWELGLRRQGFTPSLNDDWTLWSSIRREASDRDGIALVGSSRIMLGADPHVITTRTGTAAHMLAMDGSNPLPVLENLAQDPDFSGVVLYSVVPYWLSGEVTSKNDKAEKWLRKYSTQTLSSRFEASLKSMVQSTFVFRASGLSPAQIMQKLSAGKSLQPPYAPLRADRFRAADYRKTDLEKLYRSRVSRMEELHRKTAILDTALFAKRIATIQRWVDTITSRGGQVIFVRFPSCGGVLESEQRIFPRARFWDVFTAEITAPTIHFLDHDNLNSFQCTDGSHLQYDDAARFTNNLISLLEGQNLL